MADASRRAAVVAGSVLLAATVLQAGPRGVVREPIGQVALFQIDNLSSGAITATDIKQAMTDALGAEGVRVLENKANDAFMARHRVR